MQTINHACDGRVALHLLSDLHVGSAATRHDRIRRDVARAASDPSARLAIAGDVFDAILPGDEKRFDIDNLHPRVRKGDVMGEAIRWAAELLAPAAGQIIFVAPGNHDTKAAKRTSLDPVAMLCDALGVPKGEYAGLLRVNLSKRHTLNVGWWHGHGGGSSRQSAVKQSARLLDTIDGLDVCWTGHRHQRYAAPVVRYSPTVKGLKERRVWLVMSGAYMRDAAYSVEALHPPGDLGGVVLRAEVQGGEVVTEVVL